jgi:lysozyme
MDLSAAGFDLIKRFEGLRLVAYQCSAGRWTIGWGSTSGVVPGMTITEADAEDRLHADVRSANRSVNLQVSAPISQPQFDALVSFTFNLGSGSLLSSTLLRKVNSGDFMGAVNEFPRWCNVRDPSTGQLRPEAGLIRRRAAEAALFASGIADEAAPVQVTPTVEPSFEPTRTTDEHDDVSQSGSVNAARIGTAVAAGGAAVLDRVPDPAPLTDIAEQATATLRWVDLAHTYGPWMLVAVLAVTWGFIELRRRKQIAEAKR